MSLKMEFIAYWSDIPNITNIVTELAKCKDRRFRLLG